MAWQRARRWTSAIPIRPSLRSRLVGWFVAVLTGTLIVFAAVLYLSVRYGLWREFDLRLQHEADSSRSVLAPYWTPDGISAPTYINPLPENDPRWVEVWSTDGRRLFASPRAEAQHLPDIGAPVTTARRSTRSASGEPVRVLDAASDIIGLPVIVRVVQSEIQVRTVLRTIAGLIGVAFFGCLAISVWGGQRITRKALRPMEQLVNQTADISVERLPHGIDIAGADAEVTAVAAAFTTALQRLDVSFQQSRRFSADASHELRTPLTSIRTVGQVALQSTRDTQGYKDAIGSMVEDAERLTRLLDTLLLLARSDAQQLELIHTRIELAALLTQVVEQLEVLSAEKGQQLNLRTTPASVVGDPGVLSLAITNLLDNAIRYTPAHGRINVSIADEGTHVVVSVQDSGPGIAPEHHARLFDRFYRVDGTRSRQSGGTGLGLSIAAWAAAAHRGRISVESTVGVGSTFRLELPRL